MTADITASAPLDAATLLPGLEWSESRTRARRLLLYGFGVVMALFAVWLGISDGKIEVQDILPPVLVLGFLAVVSRRSSPKNALLRFLEQIPCQDIPITWIIKEDGYGHRDEEGETQGFTSWPEVIETVATPEGVLIYCDKGVPEWLPKTAFTTESDYTRFLAIITSKTKHSQIG